MSRSGHIIGTGSDARRSIMLNALRIARAHAGWIVFACVTAMLLVIGTKWTADVHAVAVHYARLPGQSTSDWNGGARGVPDPVMILLCGLDLLALGAAVRSQFRGEERQGLILFCGAAVLSLALWFNAYQVGQSGWIAVCARCGDPELQSAQDESYQAASLLALSTLALIGGACVNLAQMTE